MPIRQHTRRLIRWARRQFSPRRVQRYRVRAWTQRRQTDFSEFAMQVAPDIWAEAEAWYVEVQSRPRPAVVDRIQSSGKGGSADVRALYFMVRWALPDMVFETGVSTGWSSLAILSAMDRSGRGTLRSSDLTYQARGKGNFGDYVGVMVPDGLRGRWELCTDGDRVCLPRFVEDGPQIDLLHYDSDKTHEGRRHALTTLQPHLRSSAIVMIDDIDDNGHFRELVRSTDGEWWIFRKDDGGGPLGMLIGPDRQVPRTRDERPPRLP